MKIEKISDTQIRCTLNHSDLNARSLSLKELAYGSSGARELFHEMIRRAGEELGFQVEDMPLMVEAIPLSNDGIILNISKILNPEELDTRFARFAPSVEQASPEDSTSAHEVSADLLDSLRNMLNMEEPASQGIDRSETSESVISDTGTSTQCAANSAPSHERSHSLASIYRFRDLDTILRTARLLHDTYHGSNTLYKSESEHCYYLALHRGSHSPEDYNKICNILTEYGQKVRTTPATESYYREHLTVMLKDRALQKLGEV